MPELTPDRAVELIELAYGEAISALELFGVEVLDADGEPLEEIDVEDAYENADTDHFELLNLANEALLDAGSLIGALGHDDPALPRLYAHRLISVASFALAAALFSGSVDLEAALGATAAIMGSPDTDAVLGDKELAGVHFVVSRCLARVFLTVRSLALAALTENGRLALEAQESADDWPADPGQALTFVAGTALEAAGRLWDGPLDESMLYWYPTSVAREHIELPAEDETDETE